MAAKKKANNVQVPQGVPTSMYPSYENQLAPLKATTDEEIGQAYRQRKEANEFLAARGLY